MLIKLLSLSSLEAFTGSWRNPFRARARLEYPARVQRGGGRASLGDARLRARSAGGRCPRVAYGIRLACSTVSLLGIPKVVKRYLRKLLRSKVPKDTQDGTDMCKQLGLDPKDVEAADRSVNGA